MINLLPDQNKKDLQAGRTNLLLVRYNILMLGALLFTVAAIAVLYFYLSTTKASAAQTISDNRAKAGEYAQVEADAAKFRTNLSTAKSILDKEVIYTNMILKFAKLVPSGVVFDTLALDPKSFGTTTLLTAHCKTAEDASALKESFQNSGVFSDVHFQSLAINDGDTTGYPYTVSLSVIINKAAIE